MREILDEINRTGRVTRQTGFSRRDIAKMRNALRRHKITHNTPTERIMQPRAGRTHEHKIRWPVRDEAFILEQERRVRDERHTEHPLITARRKQYPDGKRK